MGKKVAWRVSQTDVDDQVTGVVSLELRKPLKITSAKVYLRHSGETAWNKFKTSVPDGVKEDWEEVQIVESSPTVLPPGVSEFSFSFDMVGAATLPPTMPRTAMRYFTLTFIKTNRYVNVNSTWELFFHVEIPRKLDLKDHLTINMKPIKRELHHALFSPYLLKDKPGLFPVTEGPVIAVTPFVLPLVRSLPHPLFCEEGATKKCLAMTASIPKRVFFPGETVTFSVNFSNTLLKPVACLRAELFLAFPRLSGRDGKLEEWQESRAAKLTSVKIPNTQMLKGEDIVGDYSFTFPPNIGWSSDNDLFESRFFFRVLVELKDENNHPFLEGKILILPESHITAFTDSLRKTQSKYGAPVAAAAAAATTASTTTVVGAPTPRSEYPQAPASEGAPLPQLLLSSTSESVGIRSSSAAATAVPSSGRMGGSAARRSASGAVSSSPPPAYSSPSTGVASAARRSASGVVASPLAVSPSPVTLVAAGSGARRSASGVVAGTASSAAVSPSAPISSSSSALGASTSSSALRASGSNWDGRTAAQIRSTPRESRVRSAPRPLSGSSLQVSASSGVGVGNERYSSPLRRSSSSAAYPSVPSPRTNSGNTSHRQLQGAVQTSLTPRSVDVTPSPSWGMQVTRIIVTIIRATNLRVAAFDGNTDAFCCLRFGVSELVTEVCEDTIDPEWNHSFKFSYPDLDCPLEFRVYHMRSTWILPVLLGEGAVDISRLRPGATPFTLDIGHAGTLELMVEGRV